MISFGAAFGYTVMARMSLLIGRLTDLLVSMPPTVAPRSGAFLTVATLIALSCRASTIHQIR